MKKNKKVIIGILVALLAAVVGIGAFFFTRSRNKEKVKVYSMELLGNDYGFEEEGEEKTGTVSSDYIEEIKIDSSLEVKKIFVKKGDKVKKGQKILKYDAEEDELNLKLEKLQIQSGEAKIKKEEEQLERLKKGDTKVLDEGDLDINENDSNDDSDTDPEARTNPLLKLAGNVTLVVSAAERSTSQAFMVAQGPASGAGTTVEKPAAKTGLVYNGTEIIGVEEAEQYTLEDNKATDAGDYTAKATLKEGYTWADGTKDPVEIPFTIAKKPVKKPTVSTDPLVYNGKEQIALVEEENAEGYEVKIAGDKLSTDGKVINAGDYEATVTLDKNHIWEDNDTDEIVLPFTVEKAKLTVSYKDAEITSGEKIPKKFIYQGFIEGETQKNAAGFKAPDVDTSKVSGPGKYQLIPTKGTGGADNYEFVCQAGSLIVNAKVVEDVLTLSQYQSRIKSVGGSSTSESPYIINITTDGKAGSAKIKGNVIDYIKAKKHYVIIREYTIGKKANSKTQTNILVISSKVKTSGISSTGSYKVSQLQSGKIDAGNIEITPARKKVEAGSNYKFSAYQAGVNITGFSSWNLSGNKSKYTSLTGSRLTVYSSETANKLTITAAFNGESDKIKPKVVKDGSGKTSTKTTRKTSTKTSTKDDDDDDDDNGGGGGSDVGYTKDEINDAILERERDLSEDKAELAQLKIDYKEHKATVKKALVKAKISGTVTKACTLNSLPEGDEPAVIIKGAEGMYVKTTVNEMDLSTVKVGGTLKCTSYETETEYEAVVTEVSDYPVGTDSDMGSGTNPNSSRYPVVAYIKKADGLHNGETVTIRYSEESMGTVSDNSLYLSKAYVRSEGKQYYVYKRGEDRRLKKQYVQIGDTAYGDYMQILSGVSLDDYLAFPYGKNVKEGARTKISDNMDEVIY